MLGVSVRVVCVSVCRCTHQQSAKLRRLVARQPELIHHGKALRLCVCRVYASVCACGARRTPLSRQFRAITPRASGIRHNTRVLP